MKWKKWYYEIKKGRVNQELILKQKTRDKKTQELIFRMPKEVHEKLRNVAFKRNISMSLYVNQAVAWRLENEEE